MMMLPGTTVSPPNFLTPSRRPRESRPLRDEPPAFLCAMTYAPRLAGVDAGDAQHGQLLAMTVLAPVIVTPPLLEDQHLVGADLLDHLGGDRGAGEAGLVGGRLGAVAEHQHLAERHGGAGLTRQLLDGDDVVLGDFVLLAAGADDGEHGLRFVLKMATNARAGAPVRGWRTIAARPILSSMPAPVAARRGMV